MRPAPRGDRLHLWRVAEVAASLQAAVEPSFGPRYTDEDDDDAGLGRKGWSGADALESTRSAHPAAALIARVVRQHADKCGDGSRAMVGAIAAGLRRAAEACGDGPPDGPVARERRARLVNALVRLSRGDAAAVLFETLTRVAVVVPVPRHGRWARRRSGDAGAADDDGGTRWWHRDDAFRAAARSVAGTVIAGAVASRETRARLASVVASLVTNTLRAASEDDGAFEDDDDTAGGDTDHAAFVHRTLRALASDPPLVLAPGDGHHPRAGQSRSCVVEGVLVRRNGRNGRRARVPGVDGECGVVVMYRTAPTDELDDRYDRYDAPTRVELACSETRLAGWRRESAAQRAGVLARRRVRLVFCTEEAGDDAVDSFAENGIEIVQGVSELDALRVCRVLRVLPCTSSLPNALETCDVGIVDGLSAQRIGGDAFAYLRTDRAFTGIIHGVDFVQARAARNLVARALAAVATASVPSVHPVAELAGEEGRAGAEGGAEGADGVPRGGSLTLVPGAGAADSCVVAAVKERLDELRAGNMLRTRDKDGDGGFLPPADAAATTAAWEVLLATARACPAMLASSACDRRARRYRDEDGGGGCDDDDDDDAAASIVVRTWPPVDDRQRSDVAAIPVPSFRDHSGSRSVKTRSFSAARLVATLHAVNASAMRSTDRRVPCVGLLVPGASCEAFVPGTASAMFDEPPIPDALVRAIETGERRYTESTQLADPGKASTFEALAGKYAALIGALDVVTALARIDAVLPVTRGVSVAAFSRTFGARRLRGSSFEGAEGAEGADSDGDGASSYAEDGDDTDFDDD
ncbi:predicted protein [Micromonas commoda]|uniref:Uncharacterized protein n=1 Tax=Micromonas commoda (strain RCC299 / NOUM17 / CCMP2709) TaxID=296587 RepID=C1EI92_MICCC|nr:predicted protein [Micromonas commoda]ACO67640.1 predicted protein [Micromonas commoda]|eukprot:XP_002506382.1 predicted protein [Micromonas commoda]